MEIKINKSQVMRLSSSNASLQIKVNTFNSELKGVDHFKCHGSVLTSDGYCTREIKMRIYVAKEAFNRKISLLTVNIELRKKLVRYYVWSIGLNIRKTWTLTKLEPN